MFRNSTLASNKLITVCTAVGRVVVVVLDLAQHAMCMWSVQTGVNRGQGEAREGQEKNWEAGGRWKVEQVGGAGRW